MIFADKDKSNIALDNLMLVSLAELAVMNRQGLIFKDKDLTAIGKSIAALTLQINKRRRK